MIASPLLSLGARMERKAIRRYLQRKLKKYNDESAYSVCKEMLQWVLTRQKRYDSRPGGLGRSRRKT